MTKIIDSLNKAFDFRDGTIWIPNTKSKAHVSDRLASSKPPHDFYHPGTYWHSSRHDLRGIQKNTTG
ncbi:MAG: hypothetical protein IPK21_16410 [Haliscomenobacter sp.]|nr:hypothetical protein [Haliscomenobacter sp.]